MNATHLTLALLTLTACGQQTPKYGIAVNGTNDLADVDRAWEIASGLVSVDPAITSHKSGVIAYFQRDPIRMGVAGSANSPLYHGTTVETVSQVQVVGKCMLGSDTPTVHEFLHIVLWLKNGDNDLNHTNENWHKADGDFGPCVGEF